MPENITITGGASEEIAAAISAVVASIETEELHAASVQPKPIHQSQWKRAGRSSRHLAPLHPNAPSTTDGPDARDV